MITSFSGYGVGVWMSWNRLVSRIFAAQKLRQHRLEFGYSGRGYVPDFVQIDTDVVVDQDVAHSAYRLPIQLVQTAPRHGRNPLGGLADHLDIPDDGVL